MFGVWTIAARAAGAGYARGLLALLAGPTSIPSNAHTRPHDDVRGELATVVAELQWLLARRRELGQNAGLLWASDALERDVSSKRRRILDLLGSLYDARAIRRVAAHFDTEGAKQAYAHELLELTLDRRDRSLVLPVLFPDLNDGRTSECALGSGGRADAIR